MKKEVKRDKRRLVKAYWSSITAMCSLVLMGTPAFAASGGTIWDRFSSIMQDVYGQLVAISTIVAVTVAAAALIVRMVSRNQRAVDEATSWLKRIVITWIVLNVWFLRAFNSSVGQYIANGGALTSGQGSIFLWFFCALAFLKTAQRFDSYLASLGLNVAQTGSSMGMEMLMAARVLSGVSGGAKSTGNVFKGGSAATGTGAAASGFASALSGKFKGNSYVRDAVVDGGQRMGMGGSVGFVGRAFGGMAARNGAVLTGDSIASVASRPENVSGSIAGDIADRSLANYMPQLGGYTLSDTQITGGHISTSATDAAGNASSVELFNAAQYDKPDVPHSVVTASDGSTWYQMASGEGSGAFYDAPAFTGSAGEASAVVSVFPGIDGGTMLRTVDDGVMEATSDSGSSLWYNSAYYDEPDAPHEVVTAANGVDWYAMQPPTEAPAFEAGEEAAAYNRAVFQDFMPGYAQPVTAVEGEGSEDGHFAVRHADDSDNYAAAAKHISRAAQSARRSTAAAASVRAGAATGKAVAGSAAGVAMTGPWGAALSAAWELRHTLFKVLILLCLVVLFFIILIVSIPSILLGSVLGDDSTGAQTLQANYNSLAYVVDAAVERGHELALERVEQIISDGGYNYELSMAALIDNAQSAAGYDVGWILAAYSASLAQQDTSAGDMAAKLEAVAADMFPVTYTEGSEAAAETISYSPVTVTVPVYSGGQITGTRQATYYTPSGSAPEASRVVVCTIHPFDSSVIYEAFGIDPDAVYDQFNITCAEAIDYMADALSKTLYGAENSTTTSAEAMSEAEISALVSALYCSDERKRVLETALSLVGRVPYFWGGKSAPGWNDEWNTPKLVTAAGSTTTGTIRPYGLDCSGFSDWTYQTALSVTIGAGTWGQWNASTEISEGELIPGDLGFQNLPNADTNHVLIYAGMDADGRQLWVHCTSGSGVVLNSPDYIRYYRRPNVALGDT